MLSFLTAADSSRSRRLHGLSWLIVAVLLPMLLMLLAATQHNHALDSHVDSHAAGCSACFVASVPPASQPLAPLALAAPVWIFRYGLAVSAQPDLPAPSRFLIPHAHGPPRPSSHR